MIGWRWRQNIRGFVRRKYLHGWSHAQVIHSLAKDFRGRWCKWHPGDWEIWELSIWQHFYDIKTDLRGLCSNSRGQVASNIPLCPGCLCVTGDIVTVSATWVMGSFMTSTSVTVPNWPKYSRSLSWFVCQLRPPTNSFPGAESELGVLRPLDSPCKMEQLLKYFTLITLCLSKVVSCSPNHFLQLVKFEPRELPVPTQLKLAKSFQFFKKESWIILLYFYFRAKYIFGRDILQLAWDPISFEESGSWGSPASWSIVSLKW